MKILIISPCGTHPPSEGNRQRILNLSEAIEAEGHETHLALLPNSKFVTGNYEQMEAYWGHRLHILYRQNKWGIGSRIRRQIAKIINPILRRLDFAPAAYKIIPCIDNFYIDWWDTRLLLLQKLQRYDTVIVEYVFFSRAFANFGPEVKKIIDTHDRFAQRDHEIESKIDKPSSWLSVTVEEEAAGLNRADTILGIQQAESTAFSTMTQKRVITVGHFIPQSKVTTSANPSQGKIVTFIGSPNSINVQACEWFIRNVLPRVVHAIPDMSFRIVGDVGSKLATEDASQPGVVTVGRVDDLEQEYAHSDVIVNPVQFGTGLAIKSIEAVAYGKPLLCSPEGGRGLVLPGHADKPCAIASSPEEFAEQLITLLNEPDLRQHYIDTSEQFVQQWNAYQTTQLQQALNSNNI